MIRWRESTFANVRTPSLSFLRRKYRMLTSATPWWMTCRNCCRNTAARVHLSVDHVVVRDVRTSKLFRLYRIPKALLCIWKSRTEELTVMLRGTDCIRSHRSIQDFFVHFIDFRTEPRKFMTCKARFCPKYEITRGSFDMFELSCSTSIVFCIPVLSEFLQDRAEKLFF